MTQPLKRSVSWQGEGVTEDPSPERSVRDVAELLAALDLRRIEDLEDLLYDTFDDPDVHVDIDIPGEVAIVRDGIGLGREFPFTLSEFWAIANKLDAEIMAQQSWASLSETIGLVEGLHVEITAKQDEGDSDAELVTADEYPFDEPAPDDLTVADWQATRFDACYPTLSVEVLAPDGTPADPSERLGTIRSR